LADPGIWNPCTVEFARSSRYLGPSQLFHTASLFAPDYKTNKTFPSLARLPGCYSTLSLPLSLHPVPLLAAPTLSSSGDKEMRISHHPSNTAPAQLVGHLTLQDTSAALRLKSSATISALGTFPVYLPLQTFYEMLRGCLLPSLSLTQHYRVLRCIMLLPRR
jgi:hypothetical protein